MRNAHSPFRIIAPADFVNHLQADDRQRMIFKHEQSHAVVEARHGYAIEIELGVGRRCEREGERNAGELEKMLH